MPYLIDPNAITTEREYLDALEELETLMLSDPGTPEGRRFDRLDALIDAWEISVESSGSPELPTAA